MSYYPCVFDNPTARILMPVGPISSKDEAERFLKKYYRTEWLKTEAIPQESNYLRCEWIDYISTDEFITSYIKCAIWSSVSDDKEEEKPITDDHDIYDIAFVTLIEMVKDCRKFKNENYDLISLNLSLAGHSFWLNRNGHGTGFWDYPELWGKEGADKLSRASNKFKHIDLYCGDDGKIYA